uniref:ascorbate ferrireductase (transmembrane) n=1 Tax=Meloidogyne incognita TaxID=6306 RepID=A0A914LPH1_MELIC
MNCFNQKLNSSCRQFKYNIIIILLLTLLQHLSATHFDTSQCGASKRCVIGGCPQQNNQQLNNCHYFFSVKPDMENVGESVEIELFTKKSSPETKYIAVGFSEDVSMGDDYVTYCVVNPAGQVEVHLGNNPAGQKSNQAAGEANEGGVLEMLESKATEDGIFCRFRQHYIASNKYSPNLKHPYHLLLAKGPAENPQKLDIHDLDPTNPTDFPFASAEPVLLLNPEDAAKFRDSASKNTSGSPKASGAAKGGNGLNFVDLHGILMLISWLGMTTVAIYSARYMRDSWPHTTVMGLKIWFHIHRTLNFLAVILMVASIVFIVWNKGTWTGPWFGMAKIGAPEWHSLAGAFAVLLAFSQPFGALIRCGIDDPKRPIFNWIHRSIGLIAFLLAQVAIYLAISTFKSHFALADFAFCFLIIFYVALVIFIVVSEVLRFIELREREKISAIEMQTRTRGSTPSDAYYYHTRKNFSSKLVSARRTLFFVAACTFAGSAFILVLLVLVH